RARGITSQDAWSIARDRVGRGVGGRGAGVGRWKMILLLDNYDSFTFNLYQALSQLGADVIVRRNDAVTVDDVERLVPTLDGVVTYTRPPTPRGAGSAVY